MNNNYKLIHKETGQEMNLSSFIGYVAITPNGDLVEFDAPRGLEIHDVDYCDVVFEVEENEYRDVISSYFMSYYSDLYDFERPEALREYKAIKQQVELNKRKAMDWEYLMEIQQLNPFMPNYDIEVMKIIKRLEESWEDKKE